VEHSRAQRASDNNSKDDLNKASEIDRQSDLDIKDTQTRNNADNTPDELSASETVNENEALDTPALSLYPSDTSKQTHYEYKVRANSITLQ